MSSSSDVSRDDLQGIRGVAILFVLIMHLKPNVFRIGFIGVDIFYVLSGFLMTKILCEKKFSTTSISTFYLRRFKRIVPLYLLVVLATYIYGYFALLYPDRKQIADDLLWVCTFTSNCQPIFEKLGYWDQLSTYRFFVHTWSLAVELQYYAIVPIIIGSAMLCSKTSRLIVFVLLVASSLCFQLRSEPKVGTDEIYVFYLFYICSCFTVYICLTIQHSSIFSFNTLNNFWLSAL
ncbi:unnamed protein product [Heligmosomoides polygyrus]|uniref:Acyltransferase 3 domain-containing protein n=1 Tax=Heligmosomoides polygyrus TaxID=6339 RepID=A0A3P8EAI9_HELPZ|nr:unnamed protein product [Heligmosomoides polygyrus]